MIFYKNRKLQSDSGNKKARNFIDVQFLIDTEKKHSLLAIQNLENTFGKLKKLGNKKSSDVKQCRVAFRRKISARICLSFSLNLKPARFNYAHAVVLLGKIQLQVVLLQ